jgi:iron complex outermembrane receptor protein
MKKNYNNPNLGVSTMLQAQNTISGTVTNIEKPIKGFQFMHLNYKGTTTDDNGEYILNNLPNGSLKLTCICRLFKSI